MLDLSQVGLLHVAWELADGGGEAGLKGGSHGSCLRDTNSQLEVSELKDKSGNREGCLGNFGDVSLDEDSSEASAEGLSINATGNEEAVSVGLKVGDGSGEGKSCTIEILVDDHIVFTLGQGVIKSILKAVKLLVLLENNKVDNSEDVVDELVDVVKVDGAEIGHVSIPRN